VNPSAVLAFELTTPDVYLFRWSVVLAAPAFRANTDARDWIASAYTDHRLPPRVGSCFLFYTLLLSSVTYYLVRIVT